MRFFKGGLAVAGGAAMLFSQVGFVAAADMATISNTGFGSVNKVKIGHFTSNSLHQGNTSSVVNTVVAHADTGHNQANQNTGDASVTSGDAGVGVGISNAGNSNVAEVDPCGCQEDETVVAIDETGAKSYNKITVHTTSLNSKLQKNKSWVANTVVVGAQTGGNKANKNTGDASVESGTAETVVEVVNEGSTNVLGSVI